MQTSKKYHRKHNKLIIYNKLLSNTDVAPGRSVITEHPKQKDRRAERTRNTYHLTCTFSRWKRLVHHYDDFPPAF